jgi:hypothetical protein
MRPAAPPNRHFRTNSILKDEMTLFAAIRFADCWVWYRAEQQPVLTIDHDPVMVGVHA